VRLPVAPLSSNPEGVPGFALLLNSYTERMDETMTQWYKSIVAQVCSRCEHVFGQAVAWLAACASDNKVPASEVVSGWGL
jgi:hypothetical protein